VIVEISGLRMKHLKIGQRASLERPQSTSAHVREPSEYSKSIPTVTRKYIQNDGKTDDRNRSSSVNSTNADSDENRSLRQRAAKNKYRRDRYETNRVRQIAESKNHSPPPQQTEPTQQWFSCALNSKGFRKKKMKAVKS